MNTKNMYEYYDENGRKITAPIYDSRTGQPLSGRYEQVPLGYDAPVAYPDPINAGMPQDEVLWRKIETARIELQKNAEKNRQEIEKKAALEQIKTAGERKRAEIRSDVAAKAALHNEEVIVLRDGRVTVRKEKFDGYEEKFAPFRVIDEPLIYRCDKAEGKILFVDILLASDNKAELYVRLSFLTANRINEAFNKIGMSFGMGKKKECELREKFVNALVACARLKKLPYCDDWYRTDSGWEYVSSSEKTWVGVLKNVNR